MLTPQIIPDPPPSLTVTFSPTPPKPRPGFNRSKFSVKSKTILKRKSNILDPTKTELFNVKTSIKRTQRKRSFSLPNLSEFKFKEGYAIDESDVSLVKMNGIYDLLKTQVDRMVLDDDEMDDDECYLNAQLEEMNKVKKEERVLEGKEERDEGVSVPFVSGSVTVPDRKRKKMFSRKKRGNANVSVPLNKSVEVVKKLKRKEKRKKKSDGESDNISKALSSPRLALPVKLSPQSSVSPTNLNETFSLPRSRSASVRTVSSVVRASDLPSAGKESSRVRALEQLKDVIQSQLSMDFNGMLLNDSSLPNQNTQKLRISNGNLIGGDLVAVTFCIVSVFDNPFYLNSMILTHLKYGPSSEFMKCFFSLYKLFDKDALTGKQAKKKILSCLTDWFKLNINDFREGAGKEEFDKFLVYLESTPKEKEIHTLLRSSYRISIRTAKEMKKLLKKISTHPQVPPILYGNMEVDDGDSFSILDFHPTEIARQISLIDYELFSRVPIVELINKNFEKNRAPHLQRLNDWFNRASSLVVTEVLNELNLKKRVEVLAHFILVAEKLKQLQNYNAFVAICSGISSFPISRLYKTWRTLPSIFRSKWGILEATFNPVGNFRNIRELEESASPPMIPSITLILHDLILIEEGNVDYIEDTIINIEKTLLLGKNYEKWIQYQCTPYILATEPSIKKYLKSIPLLSEEQQEQSSFDIEPSKQTK